jgi:hypothetical protein
MESSETDHPLSLSSISLSWLFAIRQLLPFDFLLVSS